MKIQWFTDGLHIEHRGKFTNISFFFFMCNGATCTILNKTYYLRTDVAHYLTLCCCVDFSTLCLIPL